MLDYRFKILNDEEGSSIPESITNLIDTHVHIFPDKIMEALFLWFDNYAWPIRYKLKAEDIIQYLLDRNVSHIVTLQYSHKPGMAEYLNSFSLKIKEIFKDKITALATIFPGEKKSENILIEAFNNGLGGVKLHQHVQCFEILSDEMEIIYDTCAKSGKPLIIHAGREPKSPEYSCDPYKICKASKIESVLKNFPNLKLCVPHLGADEYLEYKDLIEKYDNLWLDTAMFITDYLPVTLPYEISDLRLDRIMYGTDFPSIPYAWDRELKEILNFGLSEDKLELILYKNAIEFYDISL